MNKSGCCCFFFLPSSDWTCCIHYKSIHLAKTYPNFIKYGFSVQVQCLQKHPKEKKKSFETSSEMPLWYIFIRNIMRFFSNKNWHQSSRGKPTKVHKKKTFSWWHGGGYKSGLIMYFWEHLDTNILLTRSSSPFHRHWDKQCNHI